MSGLVDLVIRNWKLVHPPSTPKDTNALRLGVLGAAKIAPLAIIYPAGSHAGVVVAAVAARSLDRAKEFARKHDIPTAYGSYQGVVPPVRMTTDY